MTALSETIRDELRARVREMESFQATDFIWTFVDVEFHPLGGLIGDAKPTAQHKTLMTCTHLEDPAIEFRVVGVQRGNTHEFDLVCEYAPALMFSDAVVEIDGPTEIGGQLGEWLAVVARQLTRAPSMSRRIDELVERVAPRLRGDEFVEPFSDPRRDQLKARLGQVAALALVLRESSDDTQHTSLSDAHKDAKHLAAHLAEVPRGRAMRWIVGIIARADCAWQLASDTDQPHGTLQELWDTADLKSVLGADYRTRARLSG